MKSYACPFCNEKYHRDTLANHIEKQHDDEVPHDLTPYRVAYDVINDHPDHFGRCSICGAKTKWNERTNKYHRLCGKQECYDAVKKTYQKRMLRVYNKIYLTDDPEHQEKMLAGRRISGRYKWSDGRVFTYTGSYEKKLLEFLDGVMNFKSNEIVTPGPVLEYKYKGQVHRWITDCFIIPFNLIIEIKDGGDNPNKRIMVEYRAKQVAKEKMITSLGTYNYARIVNNDYGQLLSIIAELKMQVVEDNKTPLYRIHESLEEFDHECLMEANRLEGFCNMAEMQLDNQFLINEDKFPLAEVSRMNGMYTNPNNCNEDVLGLALLTPKSKLINGAVMHRFQETMNNFIEILNDRNSYDGYNLSWNFNGFFLNEDHPNQGFLLGIEICD